MRFASTVAVLVLLVPVVSAITSEADPKSSAPTAAPGLTVLQSEAEASLLAASNEPRPDPSRTSVTATFAPAAAAPQAAAPSVVVAETEASAQMQTVANAAPQADAVSVLTSEAPRDAQAPLPASTPATLVEPMAVTTTLAAPDAGSGDVALSADNAVVAELVSQATDLELESGSTGQPEPQPAAEPARLESQERTPEADKPPAI